MAGHRTNSDSILGVYGCRMTTLDVLLPVVAAGIVVLLFSRPVRTSRAWRATITPLASIIGSGFLVVVPLLGHSLGGGSLWAILAIVVFAYAVGEVLRFNIVHLEPLLTTPGDDCQLANETGSTIQRIELLASLSRTGDRECADDRLVRLRRNRGQDTRPVRPRTAGAVLRVDQDCHHRRPAGRSTTLLHACAP